LVYLKKRKENFWVVKAQIKPINQWTGLDNRVDNPKLIVWNKSMSRLVQTMLLWLKSEKVKHKGMNLGT